MFMDMKAKINIYIFTLAALSAVACSRETDILQSEGLLTLKIVEAKVSEIPETKAHLEDGSKIIWDLTDMIGIFSDRDNAVPFSKSSSGNSFSSETAVSGHEFFAFYPYSEDVFNPENRKQLSFNIGDATIASGANPTLAVPMVAKAEGTSFSFTQTCGILHFSITGTESLHSLTLTGNKNEKIAGAFTVNMEDTTPVLSGDGSEETQVFTPDSPVALSSETPYDVYFILPPMTFEEGFSISINYGTGNIVKKTEKSVTVTRAIIRNYDVVNLDQLIEEETSWMKDAVPPDDEIWYTTKTHTIINLEESYYPFYNISKPFDSNVVSHTYENGKGIIKCDGPITMIYDFVFYSIGEKIDHIFLPNSIEILNAGALHGIGVEELRVPDNLKLVNSYALNSSHIKQFTGSHTSEDGRCVILNYAPYGRNTVVEQEGYLAAFAPAGLSSYTVPSNVQVCGEYAFAWCPELKEIHFNEGLKSIWGDCFVGDYLDCDIVLPSTLESLDPYAFRSCRGVKGFYGNEKFHTSDHHCLLFYNGTWISKFCGDDVTDYIVPDGIVGIENYAFEELPLLTTVTLPSSIEEVGWYAFYRCENLTALYGDCVSEDHKAIVFGTQFRRLFITKGIKQYTIPDNITSLGSNSFSETPELEEIIVPDNVIELGGYDFAWCHNLKKVVLSANLKRVNSYNPFSGSYSLEEVYFRSYFPPMYSDTQFSESDCAHLTVYVPEETIELYKNSGWYQYAPYMVGYKYDDIEEWNPDYYLSSDYSANGTTNALQQSSVGAGIDLVMGDAFSDRQIADGTYANVMQKAADAFFSEEPYKSMKDRFNVYTVNVVSATEGYEHSGQALSTGHGGGTYVYGNDAKIIEYAKNAIGEDRMDDAVIVVMMNEDAYAGTCFMYYPPSGDYGRGLSIAYFPTSSDTDTFNGVVSHEAGGHGFAKLADEYAYEDMGTISEDAISNIRAMEPYGLYKNVDFTSAPTQVKWSQFIADNRYASENIGCFEGGLTYWSGVWRPTENSIMRYNTGGFNAPSRYAIWYRINKLAYGEDWEGGYEDFVTFDQAHHQSTASTKSAPRNFVEKQLPPLAQPVVVNKDWRELLNK